MRVVDSTTHPAGFDDDNHGANLDTTDDYKYDTNGNLTSDENKGISSIIYNHLNLPVEIIFSGTNRNIIYLYDATGRKVRKVVSDGTTVTQTDYLGGFQYEKVDAGDVELKFFMHAEGYVNNTVVDDVNVYNYVYNYTDHLGNIRLTYTWDSKDNVPKIMEENHYYPFGYKHAKYNAATWDYVQDDSGEYNLGVVLKSDTELAYKYKYNGQEYQDELGLNMMAMDFRQYDPAIARFNSMDAFAEEDPDFTPYRFAYDNPLYWNDPLGLHEQGGDHLAGWVNQGSKTFWDPEVNNQNDARRLHGDDANYVPDNSIMPNGDGTSTRYNPDGTKTEILPDVVIQTKAKTKSEDNRKEPGFNPWGPTLIGLGQPLNFLKPVGALGSEPGSSIASWTLEKVIPYRNPVIKQTTRKVVAKIIGKKVAKRVGTAVLGRFLGRLVPWVGWGILANDLYQNRAEINSWILEQQANNEANIYNADGTWNAGWGASTCFVKGTLVHGENKLSPIENIKIGDVVYSYNFRNDKVELSKVVNTLSRETQAIYEISTNNEIINVTAEHPVYVINKGWTKVKELNVGDNLKTFDGNSEVSIKSIRQLVKNITVYNIEVDGNNNYFVTSSAILVHNKNITEIYKSKKPKKKDNNGK